MPKLPIEGLIANASALTQVIVDKFANGILLYKQSQDYERVGLSLSRQNLSNWTLKSSDLLAIVYQVMKKELLNKKILHADETTLQVLNKSGKPAKSKSYMWLHQTGRFDRPIVIYDYNSSRFGEITNEFLKDFSGYLHTDGYSGLAIISPKPIEINYLEAGFFQGQHKNDEHALVYLRTLIDDDFNGYSYFKNHRDYMKKYVTIYAKIIYTSVIVGTSLFFIILFSFNQSLDIIIRLIPVFISIILLVLIFIFKHLLKKHNQRGESLFGFPYDMVYINQFHYKFRIKTKAFFISCIQAFIDLGL